MTASLQVAISGIGLRPETDADLPFLQALYASAREREMALLTHWSAEEKAAFLESQFAAQRSYYRQHYPNASYDIIESNGEAIGRLYIADMPELLNLMDITLLPSARNSGLGTDLVRSLQARAEQEAKIVLLHVEEDNPARRLYDRLGFAEVGEITFYKRMHWVPSGLEEASARLAAEAARQS